MRTSWWAASVYLGEESLEVALLGEQDQCLLHVLRGDRHGRAELNHRVRPLDFERDNREVVPIRDHEEYRRVGRSLLDGHRGQRYALHFHIASEELVATPGVVEGRLEMVDLTTPEDVPRARWIFRGHDRGGLLRILRSRTTPSDQIQEPFEVRHRSFPSQFIPRTTVG